MSRSQQHRFLIFVVFKRLRQLFEQFDDFGQIVVFGIIRLKRCPIALFDEQLAQCIDTLGVCRIDRQNATPRRNRIDVVIRLIAIQRTQFLECLELLVCIFGQGDAMFHNARQIAPTLFALVERFQRRNRFGIVRIAFQDVFPNVDRRAIIAHLRLRNIGHFSEQFDLIGQRIHPLQFPTMNVEQFFPISTLRIQNFQRLDRRLVQRLNRQHVLEVFHRIDFAIHLFEINHRDAIIKVDFLLVVAVFGLRIEQFDELGPAAHLLVNLDQALERSSISRRNRQKRLIHLEDHRLLLRLIAINAYHFLINVDFFFDFIDRIDELFRQNIDVLVPFLLIAAQNRQTPFQTHVIGYLTARLAHHFDGAIECLSAQCIIGNAMRNFDRNRRLVRLRFPNLRLDRLLHFAPIPRRNECQIFHDLRILRRFEMAQAFLAFFDLLRSETRYPAHRLRYRQTTRLRSILKRHLVRLHDATPDVGRARHQARQPLIQLAGDFAISVQYLAPYLCQLNIARVVEIDDAKSLDITVDRAQTTIIIDAFRPIHRR